MVDISTADDFKREIKSLSSSVSKLEIAIKQMEEDDKQDARIRDIERTFTPKSPEVKIEKEIASIKEEVKIIKVGQSNDDLIKLEAKIEALSSKIADIKAEKGDKGDTGDSIKGDKGKDGVDGIDGIDGKEGKEGTVDKKVVKDLTRQIDDLAGKVAHNVSLPPTTSFFNGKRAKNLIIPGVVSQSGDTATIDIHQEAINTTAKTSDYTILSSDVHILCDATSGSITVTLPKASDNQGRVYNIKKIDSSINTVIIDGDGSETIDGTTTISMDWQYVSVTIVSDGSNWHII